jgi:predicted nucleic acid-binding protein
MGAVVLDSSVVIGFVRSNDAHHQNAVSEVRAARSRDDTFVLPATVLGECLVGAQRAGASVAESMRRDLVDFFGPVRQVDEEVAFVMSALRGRVASLRVPDALVVATGIVDNAVVLTCDKRLAAVDSRVQVVGG